MRKLFGCVVCWMCLIHFVTAQHQPIIHPVFEFGYYLQGEGGANGLTVTYNPNNGYYYCIQAGNADFPLEAFTEGGSMVYTTTAKIDARGFWYNPLLKCFQGTRFVSGAFTMYLNEQGMPSNPVMLGNASGFIPPVDQSQVVCNVTKKELYAYSEDTIYVYNQITYQLKKKIKLQKSPVTSEYLNPYAMFYSGHKNYEFGLYDVINNQVLLFNAKGVFTQSIQMPGDAPYIDVFRLGFANNRLFLYDGDYRAWLCYRIFSDGSGN
jgi:hypothetical protein